MSIWYQWRHDGSDLQVDLLENHEGLRARNETDRGRTYVVPDFLVDMFDGKSRLLEIKPSDRLVRPTLPRKLAAMRLFAEQRGWTFHLLTEKELICGPLLGNLRLIGRYRHARTDELLLEKLQRLVPEHGMPLAHVIRCAEDSGVGNARVHVFHLIANGHLSLDPTQRTIDDQTLLYPEGVITWDPFASVWAPSGCSTGGPGAWSASRARLNGHASQIPKKARRAVTGCVQPSLGTAQQPTGTSPKTPSSS